MTAPLFDLPAVPHVPVADEDAGYPVQRIFCVGRNYAAHAAEMGNRVDRAAPFYFTKTPQTLCLNGAEIAYPLATADCHHEVELVVALGAPAFRSRKEAAMQAVLGFACGIDLTRRDLQAAAKEKRRPWDLGKDFEESAMIGEITRKEDFGPLDAQAIRLSVDGTPRQDATLAEMIWSVPDLIADLSRYYHLGPGDLIYTGTPAGVGPVVPGNVMLGEIDGLTPLRVTIAAPE